MYAIAAYTNTVQFNKAVAPIAQETHPGGEACTKFGLWGLRINSKE